MSKRNLLDNYYNLNLAKQAYNLLEKKRQILLQELTVRKKAAEILSKEFKVLIHKASVSLSLARMSLGSEALERINSTCVNDSLLTDYCSIMGVTLSIVKTQKKCATIPTYSLEESDSFLDETYNDWQEVKTAFVELAGIKIAIEQLSNAISHTLKRASALKYFTIPLHETNIKFILALLEEKERDELARIKTAAKNLKNSAKHTSPQN